MKEFRKKHGLSQSDIVRLLGYHNKANVSHCENSDTISQKYILALKALVESMILMTEKIDKLELKEPTFLVARKMNLVRRIYSNNHKSINSLSLFLHREVIIREKELYRYEIIVF
ncbi:hypothetical protein WAF17_02665 [Bernardetia sp. ABR2-2B]|uniref:hypothetical protein n=1 Tax=Bernardetia sp. ABR2-2B TaxID=3127472 RepID=UPI0030D23313